MKRYLVILAIVGSFLYLPSLFGSFLWDDEDFVYANKYVENFQIDKFFTDSQTAGRGKLSNYYRPIPQLVYATTHAIFGFNPFWFHLINILVHIAAAGAIFYFFTRLMSFWSEAIESSKRSYQSASPPSRMTSVTVPFLISLFFLVHPVQTEAVSYISGLSDPLFVLFGFLSLIFFPQKKSLVFFILSLLSKETGIVFLPLLFLLNYKKPLPHFLITIFYLLFHVTQINSLNVTAAWGNSPYATSVVVRLLTFIQNLYRYFGILIFPKDLFMERDFSIQIQTNPLNPYLILSLISFPSIFYLIRKNKILIFCFLAFFISFLPYSGLVLINGIFYEHFLYLPLVFFFAFLSFWLVQNRSIIFIILILLGLRNIARQFDWIDPIRFYSQTLSHAPQSIRIRNGLAMAYADKGDYTNSIREYQFSISENPHVPNLYHNLANVYLAQGDIKLAEENYLKAIEVDPRFFFSYQSLVRVYEATGEKQKLKKILQTIDNLK